MKYLHHWKFPRHVSTSHIQKQGIYFSVAPFQPQEVHSDYCCLYKKMKTGDEAI